MTRTSAVLGSPLYMSPEQMRSARDADVRSDVWGLGVILYELIGGEPPFNAESLPELVLKIVSDTPAKLRARRPEVPEALERVIFTCLEKEPARRHQSVGALAALIAPYGPGRAAASVERIFAVLRGAGAMASASSASPSRDVSRPVDAKSANTAASWGQTASRARRGGVTTWAVAGAFLAILASSFLGYRVFTASAGKVDASATPVSLPVPVAPSVAPVSAAPPAAEPPGPPVTPAVASGTPEASVVAPSRPEQAPAPVRRAQKPPRVPRSTPRSPKPAPLGDVYDDRK
jgi:serine/threonine-protein kinase